MAQHVLPLVTGAGFALVVTACLATIAWRRGAVDHRLPSGLFLVAAAVLVIPAAVGHAGETDPDAAEVAVSDVHGQAAAPGLDAPQAAGPSTRAIVACAGNTSRATVAHVHHGTRPPVGSGDRPAVDAGGATAEARGPRARAEVTAGARREC